MMNNRRERATANLRMLEFAARKLGPLMMKSYISSHDFEDIINVTSGRIEIAEEVNLASKELKDRIRSFFEEIEKDDEFITALPGHLNEGPATEQRLKIVTDRIKKIIGK